MNGDLSDYIRFNFLKPGKNVFSFNSNGKNYISTLTPEGYLIDEENERHKDICTWYLKFVLFKIIFRHYLLLIMK